MASERLCPRCGQSNPAEMPRCINCGQRVTGGLLLQGEAEQTVATEPWWRASAPGTGMGGIPVPPQVREEAARAEAGLREAERRVQEERVASELRAAEQRKRQAEEEAWLRAQTTQSSQSSRQSEDIVRQTEAILNAVSQANKGRVRTVTTPTQKTAKVSSLENCPRCDAPVGEAGATFSFCVQCGSDLAPAVKASTYHSAAAPSATTQNAVRETVNHSVSGGMKVTAAPQTATSKMNPLVPGVLSFFWPGFGQFANGQASKGVLLLLAAFVATMIFHWEAMGFLMIIMRLLAGVDAYRIAERRRTGDTVPDSKWDLG